MSTRLESLREALLAEFGDRIRNVSSELGELTVEVAADDYHAVALALRDSATAPFEQMIDLCGVDYSTHATRSSGLRYAVVVHLMSVAANLRLRLRAFVADDDFPVIASVNDVWPAANWFEREAFDLYGIMFAGHGDLRRLLTDYGFVGHPFRKDFPISGHVEMRYDPDQKRVVYQPVSIAPREVTPRVVREGNYGDVGHG
ncbi:MAG: NADH-quinone oxidoreductase subunit C [Gammaproteobacteria bacterium]|jgi:NADH-quinone oxidoreductase subunit C|nr:NADH-quinone oxidoreductase subunit C [Gammaproteobacteria bacterium]MBU0770222.1 NADH-quinone oxidoreductase subunit C [Gammaproteobacteria bacterium]MBU0857291.1 NADH-quinone oxidoreductase subunit C [Gammaproteobacteria bacterium]MBU1846256.1 NADH-quinone oxidoreductase subunit C [Gammaproteobacteria bacterium]